MAKTTVDVLRDSLVSAVGGDTTLVSIPINAEEVPVFNKDIPTIPAAIVTPSTTTEVAAIVKLAAQNGYKVQAKGGGHSYANHGNSRPKT